jgi:macrocin-O-methyltransferase TylF-like protien
MSWKGTVKHLIPPSLLNSLLLRAPFLYRTQLVNFETNMDGDGLSDLLEALDEVKEVEGDVIECGASRCGTSIILARYITSKNLRKRVLACDSFTGFRSEEVRKERASGLSREADNAYTSAGYGYVQRKLQVLGLSDTVQLIQGYFQETLSDLKGPFSLALVDCDLLESMSYCAAAVFDKLSPGGYLAFDDYTSIDFGGARIAVDKFVSDHRSRLIDLGLRRRLYFVRKSPFASD